jgi:hypothetical protein
MRPTRSDPPMAFLHQLKDGTYSLNDLADMHETLDEEAEYQKRWKAYYERNPSGGR